MCLATAGDKGSCVAGGHMAMKRDPEAARQGCESSTPWKVRRKGPILQLRTLRPCGSQLEVAQQAAKTGARHSFLMRMPSPGTTRGHHLIPTPVPQSEAAGGALRQAKRVLSQLATRAHGLGALTSVPASS